VWGVVCDPLNSAVSLTNISIGDNGVLIGTNRMSPALVNITRKMCHDKSVFSDYDQLLLPETINPFYMRNNTVDFRKNIFGAQILYETDIIMPAYDEYDQTPSQFGVFSNSVDLNDMNMNKYNMLSMENRGQMFFNKATNTFTKAVPTINYTYDTTPGTATVSPYYTIRVVIYTKFKCNYCSP
jgi:hypothetical protein